MSTSEPRPWRPGTIATLLLNLIGHDERDYEARSELAVPFVSLATVVINGVIAGVSASIVIGVMWSNVGSADRVATGLLVAIIVMMLDLWTVSWQPEASRKKTEIILGEAPSESIVPAMPNHSRKILALAPRLLMGLVLGVAIGTLLSIAANQGGIDQEKQIMLAGLEEDVEQATDSAHEAQVATATTSLAELQAARDDARVVYVDANRTAKCQLGQYKSRYYQGALCVAGGRGTALAVQDRERAQDAYTRLSGDVESARQDLDTLRAARPSEMDGFTNAASVEGLDQTLRAWWRLMRSSDHWLEYVLLLFPHLFMLMLDIVPLLFKLLRGYAAAEHRRWTRIHLELLDITSTARQTAAGRITRAILSVRMLATIKSAGDDDAATFDLVMERASRWIAGEVERVLPMPPSSPLVAAADDAVTTGVDAVDDLDAEDEPEAERTPSPVPAFISDLAQDLGFDLTFSPETQLVEAGVLRDGAETRSTPLTQPYSATKSLNREEFLRSADAPRTMPMPTARSPVGPFPTFAMFEGVGRETWVISDHPLSARSPTDSSVPSSLHSVFLAVRAGNVDRPHRLQPRHDVCVLKLMPRREAEKELELFQNLPDIFLRPDPTLVPILRPELLTEQPDFADPVALRMPYFPRADARRYWLSPASGGRETLTYRHVAGFGSQMARALSELWQQGLVYNDGKLANAIIAGPYPGLGDALAAEHGDISNFVLPIDLGGVEAVGKRIWTATPTYAAPELLIECRGTFASDAFALGASMYELLVGRTPNAIAQHRSGTEIASPGWPSGYADVYEAGGLQEFFPSGIPSKLAKLVVQLVSPWPERRLTGASVPDVALRNMFTISITMTDDLVGPCHPHAPTDTVPPSPGWDRFASFFRSVGYTVKEN